MKLYMYISWYIYVCDTDIYQYVYSPSPASFMASSLAPLRVGRLASDLTRAGPPPTLCLDGAGCLPPSPALHNDACSPAPQRI